MLELCSLLERAVLVLVSDSSKSTNEDSIRNKRMEGISKALAKA
jgi:hypothetical protein